MSLKFHNPQLQILLFRTIFESSLDGILVIDPNDQKVLEYNRQFSLLWKFPQNLTLDRVVQIITNHLISSPNNSHLLLEDGRTFEMHSESLLVENKIYGRILFFRDISDQVKAKRVEAVLTSSAKMVALGEMAGGIAHEINNPLAIIQGKAGQMKRKLEVGKIDFEKFTTDLAKIENTCDRISKIITGLRTFSRNSESDFMQKVKISKIVEDCLDLCRERFRNHSINLQVNIKENLIVECQVTQMTQVLMNLLSNSYDAVEKLKEKWIAIEVESNASSVRLSVTDSGDGISPTIREKIMQPFFTTKDVGKGTGLGLSISLGIVQNHHGQIWLDSSSKNTRFIIEIPLQQPR